MLPPAAHGCVRPCPAPASSGRGPPARSRGGCRRLRRRRGRPRGAGVRARATRIVGNPPLPDTVGARWKRGLPPPARLAGPTPAEPGVREGREALAKALAAHPAHIACAGRWPAQRLPRRTPRPAMWKAQQQRARCYHLAPRTPARSRRVAGATGSGAAVGRAPCAPRAGGSGSAAVVFLGVCYGVGPWPYPEGDRDVRPSHAEGA